MCASRRLISIEINAIAEANVFVMLIGSLPTEIIANANNLQVFTGSSIN